MKIGDEVYVHGYIDEIRKDTIIIRNDGGYFGTVQEEISVKQEPCEDAISRQAVLEQTYLWSKDEFLRVTNPFDYLRKRINSLPSVKPQEPKTDVLDKIRAEIEQERVGYPPSAGYYKAIIKCLQIIDKYKAERGEE